MTGARQEAANMEATGGNEHESVGETATAGCGIEKCLRQGRGVLLCVALAAPAEVIAQGFRFHDQVCF